MHTVIKPSFVFATLAGVRQLVHSHQEHQPGAISEGNSCKDSAGFLTGDWAKHVHLATTAVVCLDTACVAAKSCLQACGCYVPISASIVQFVILHTAKALPSMTWMAWKSLTMY